MEHVSSARPTGKFPEKVENLKRWARFPGWNFWTECRVPFTFLVVCISSRSTVGHRHVPGFTTKCNNFLPIGIPLLLPPKFPGFFPKWKAPRVTQWSCRVLPVTERFAFALYTGVKIQVYSSIFRFVKGAVLQNLAKLGDYKMPIRLRET